MFSAGVRRYFDQLAEVTGLDADEARRVLTSVYSELLVEKLHASIASEYESNGLRAELRRLVNSLEVAAVHAYRDAELRAAAAFVGAEAAYLLYELEAQNESQDAEDRLWCAPAVFVGTESALLYCIAGHDSNARIVCAELQRIGSEDALMESQQGSGFFASLTALLTQDTTPRAEPLTADIDSSLRERSRSIALATLDRLAAATIDWLTSRTTREVLEQILSTVREASPALSITQPDIGLTADLMTAAVEALSSRALRRLTDLSNASDADLVSRYVAERSRARPLLWPPAIEYVERCIEGPARHAVVSVPTGSGKGAIAEVAAANSLASGWVAYLLPTNALANQVRSDLRQAFEFADDVTVRAYLGGGEYTELGEESADEVPDGSVIVMTPEKCALALRRAPTAFNSLSLLVLDECHLIGEAGARGVTAELVVAHILSVAPDVRILMLSALLANPQELSSWIESASGAPSAAIFSGWRPTRTLRGFVGVNAEQLQEDYGAAVEQLRPLPDRRKSVKFVTPYRLLLGLQGAWNQVGEDDYLTIDVGEVAPLAAVRERARSGEWSYRADRQSWVNDSAARISDLGARYGERVLTFLPRSRHDPFVVAQRAQPPHDTDASTPGIQEVQAHEACAEYELGVTSWVASHRRDGVSVHSSAMLDAERNAAERAFQLGITRVMFATGTLAQGLNLPATLVVTAGTSLAGGSSAANDDRLRAQLLNALGRAGRAEFANHSVALAIGDRPIAVRRNPDAARALMLVPFLADEDATVNIQSRLTSFLRALADEAPADMSLLSVEEMAAISYLPLQDDDPERRGILRCSYGAWSAYASASDELIDDISESVAQAGRHYVETANVPLWTRDVAYRAGLPLPVTFDLFRATVRSWEAADSAPEDITGWVAFMATVMRSLPSRSCTRLLWSESFLRNSDLAIPKGLGFTDSFEQEQELSEDEWTNFWGIASGWLEGLPIAEIARIALGLEGEVDARRTAGGMPIPKTLGLVRRMGDRLSLAAGAIAAMFSVGLESDDEDEGRWQLDALADEALQSFPIALRTGCGSRSSLAWYRFGLRYRRPAHLLARAFPVPPAVAGDEAVATWVRDQRRAWLSAELVPADISAGESTVLEAVRTLISGSRIGTT